MKLRLNNIIDYIRSERANYVFGILLSFGLFVYTSYWQRDPDFGWHLRAGEYFLHNGIPKTDIFSFTASNFAWINHEWANDILVFTINSIGHKPLLAIFFGAIWCAALLLASRQKNTFVLLLATAASLPFSGIRPIAWTVLFVALLERLHETKNLKYRYCIPAIFLLWANLHGGFAFGLILITIWQLSKKTRIDWPVYVLSFVAVFINPYFWRIFVEIGSTLVDTQLKLRIAEWTPLKLPWLSVAYIVAFLVALFTIRSKPLRKLLSIPGLTLLMALSSIRHLPLFVATSLRELEQNIASIKSKTTRLHIEKQFMVLGQMGLLMFVIVVSVQVAFFVKQIRFSEAAYPAKAVVYIKNNPCNTNIYNHYSYGGYLIEKLPEYKYYIDGRMPSWREGKTSYFENYEKFEKDSDFRNSEISRYGINCAIIASVDRLGGKLIDAGWTKVETASTDQYSLYLHSLASP